MALVTGSGSRPATAAPGAAGPETANQEPAWGHSDQSEPRTVHDQNTERGENRALRVWQALPDDEE